MWVFFHNLFIAAQYVFLIIIDWYYLNKITKVSGYNFWLNWLLFFNFVSFAFAVSEIMIRSHVFRMDSILFQVIFLFSFCYSLKTKSINGFYVIFAN